MSATSPSDSVWETAAPLASRTLSDEHRRVLRDESGISDEIIDERGYHTLDKAAVTILVALEVVHPLALEAEGWLAIPTFRPDGQKHGEVLRLFGNKGKAKYLFPTGERNAFDIHPGYTAYTLDASIPILMTEGIKKADALLTAAERENFECVVVAVNGCYGWHSTVEGSPVASPDFLDIAWKERRVYVISDSDYRTNDNVRKGWSECATYLAGKTGPHRTQLVVVPPHGLDKQGADDWLVSGHSLADLLELAQTPQHARLDTDTATKLPLPIKSGMALIREAGERIPHIYEPLVPERAVMLAAGHSGTYKTWHALSLVLDAAFGFPWLGHPDLFMRGDPVHSIYVNKEMSGAILGHRLKSMAHSGRYADVPGYEDIIDQRIHFADEAALDLNVESQRDRLEDAIMQVGAQLVVLDSLSMSWHGEENSSTEVGALYTHLRGITERTGVTWFIVHHLTKPQGRQRKDHMQFQVRGSGQLFQQADAVIMLSHHVTDTSLEDERLLAVYHTKGRTAVEMPAFVVRFSTNDGMFVSLSYSAKLIEAKAMEYSRSHGDPTKLSSWMIEAMFSMPAMRATGPGLRFKQLVALLVAGWTEEGSPPSEATIRRQILTMAENNEIQIVETNKRLGNLYRLVESDDEGLDTTKSIDIP
jgi:hypothetical protein